MNPSTSETSPIVQPPAPRSWFGRIRRNFRENYHEHRLTLFISLLIFLLLTAFFWRRIFIPIDAGEAGVFFSRFGGGTDIEHVYGEGFHIIAPWNSMTIYNVRVQQKTEFVEALSSNGLTIMVTVSMRYFPEYNSLPLLHQKVGPNYLHSIVIPEVVSAVREIIGKYRPEELYTLKTSDISAAVLASATRQLSDKFIRFDDLLITKIVLPRLVVQAIESKLTQEQAAQAYEFRLQRETQEAKRKLIEGQGESVYQKLVTENLTPAYLKLRGIDATIKLAESPNSKLIIVGNGKDGLPVILSADPDNQAKIKLPPVNRR